MQRYRARSPPSPWARETAAICQSGVLALKRCILGAPKIREEISINKGFLVRIFRGTFLTLRPDVRGGGGSKSFFPERGEAKAGKGHPWTNSRGEMFDELSGALVHTESPCRKQGTKGLVHTNSPEIHMDQGLPNLF